MKVREGEDQTAVAIKLQTDGSEMLKSVITLTKLCIAYPDFQQGDLSRLITICPLLLSGKLDRVVTTCCI